VFSKEWAQLISKMSESFKAVEKVADSDIMLHIRKIFLSRFIWITMFLPQFEKTAGEVSSLLDKISAGIG